MAVYGFLAKNLHWRCVYREACGVYRKHAHRFTGNKVIAATLSVDWL